MQDLLYHYFDGAIIIDGQTNDVRLIGTITLILVLALAIVGMDWVTRVSNIICLLFWSFLSSNVLVKFKKVYLLITVVVNLNSFVI